MVRALAIACAFVACQGKGGETYDAPAGSAVKPVGSANVGFGKRDAGSNVGSDDDKAQPKPDVPPGNVDPDKVLAELGAIPAWQAVVDRAQLLARRKQHGVAYGKVGPPIMMTAPVLEPSPNAGVHVDAGLVPSPYVWLIDESEDHGCLAIRVKFPAKKPNDGDLVAVGGAWELDDAHAWYWKVDTVTALPWAIANDLKSIKPSPPGHVISEGYFPPGVRKISLAKDNDVVYFQVVGPPPAVDGDGWPVADELGNPVAALLNLPGERPAYGGLDMRAPDERWTLKRGQTYWVKIGVVHKHGPDKPAVMNARTAPVWIR